MLRQIVVPTDNSFTIHLPDEMIGKTVEVIAFEIKETATSLTYPEANTKIIQLNDALEGYTVNSNGYKFDRQDANEYD